MNIISRLFLLLDQARLQMEVRPVGEMYDYEGGFVGLKMIAELISRLKSRGVASLLLSPDGVYNILTLPGGNYRYGFQLDNKLEKINDSKHFLLVMQYEKNLNSQNYLVIKVDEEGSGMYIYLVRKNVQRAEYISFFDQNSHDTKALAMAALYNTCLAELEELNEGRAERLSIS